MRLPLVLDITDEFIKPINNANVDGTIQEGDVVIFLRHEDAVFTIERLLTSAIEEERHMCIFFSLRYVKLLAAERRQVFADEFIKPINNVNVDGTIQEGDVVIFFNYRNDRAKELTVVLTQHDMPEEGMHTIPGLQYYCMTPYDASFKGVYILFDKEKCALPCRHWHSSRQ